MTKPALTPLKRTALALPRFEPKIVTRLPSQAFVGEKPAGTTRTSFMIVPPPPGWSDATATTLFNPPLREVTMTTETVAVSPAASGPREQLTAFDEKLHAPALDVAD